MMPSLATQSSLIQPVASSTWLITLAINASPFMRFDGYFVLSAAAGLFVSPAPGPVLVTMFDRDRVADYQKMVQRLRDANIRAELYLGNPKNNVGQQLKYADRRGSPCAVIQGGDEKAKGEGQIKDLILGASISAIKDRDEYLKKQAEAQFAVKESDLVEGVRRVLAKHNVRWS